MNSENQSSSDNFPSNPKHTLLKLLLDKKNISFNAQPIPRQDEKSPIPLSFAQERLWFFNQLEGASATYNMPAAIRITGKLNTTAFQQALAEIVRRHQILHTSFQTVEDGPIQFINPNATIEIQITDLQHQDTTESEATIHQLAKQEALTPFDLKTAPLIRCSLLQLSPTEHVVLLTMHHIVSDAWSIGVLIQELSVLYPAFVAGLASPLPELPIQYADFAVWQRKYLSGEFLDNQLNYWHSQLQGAPDLLQLPTDRSRPSIQTYQGKTQSFTLSSRLNQQQIGRAHV